MRIDPTPASAVRATLGAQREQLLAMVRRRGGSLVDAEEVVQTALQRALERADQLRDPARAEAWVGRVVRNVLIDEIRKRHAPVLPTDTVEFFTEDDESVDCACVLVQIEQLKPEYSAILRRVVVDGVSVKHVASEFGLTPNNAMVRLHRARVALRERLASHCGTTTVRACSECGCEERGCCPQP